MAVAFPNTTMPFNTWSSNVGPVVTFTGHFASGVTGTFTGLDRFTAIQIEVLMTVFTGGTSPTLNIYFQQLAYDGTTWFDHGAIGQMTGLANTGMFLVSGGNSTFTLTDATLTAGTMRSMPFGPNWRIKWVFGGTMAAGVTGAIGVIGIE